MTFFHLIFFMKLVSCSLIADYLGGNLKILNEIYSLNFAEYHVLISLLKFAYSEVNSFKYFSIFSEINEEILSSFDIATKYTCHSNSKHI